MYDFNQYLEPDEKILYQGKSVPKASIGNVVILILVLIAMLLVQFIMIISICENNLINNPIVIIMFLVMIFFDGAIILGIINSLFLNKKKAKNCFYCLTNKRALRYDLKDNKLVYGYLINYDDIKIYNIKHNYGDLYMGITYSGTNNYKNDLVNVADALFNPDSKNMPNISFSCIENPEYVLSLAKSARAELVYNIKNNS